MTTIGSNAPMMVVNKSWLRSHQMGGAPMAPFSFRLPLLHLNCQGGRDSCGDQAASFAKLHAVSLRRLRQMLTPG